MPKNLIDKHIQEAYDIQYGHYCRMHIGYQRVDEEVKKLEQAIKSGQLLIPMILTEFEKAVRYKQEATAQWREARFYYKTLKKASCGN